MHVRLKRSSICCWIWIQVKSLWVQFSTTFTVSRKNLTRKLVVCAWATVKRFAPFTTASLVQISSKLSMERAPKKTPTILSLMSPSKAMSMNWMVSRRLLSTWARFRKEKTGWRSSTVYWKLASNGLRASIIPNIWVFQSHHKRDHFQLDGSRCWPQETAWEENEGACRGQLFIKNVQLVSMFRPAWKPTMQSRK